MAAHEDAVLKAVRDADRGRRNLAALAAHLGPRVPELLAPLARLLPRTADPDMALNNLERLFAKPEARAHLPALLEHRARDLDATLQLLATSQFFADTLANYPELLAAASTSPLSCAVSSAVLGARRGCCDTPASSSG